MTIADGLGRKAKKKKKKKKKKEKEILCLVENSLTFKCGDKTLI